MSFRPAKPYTRASATARARQLDATAFAKVARSSPRESRCQILVELPTRDVAPIPLDVVETYLVASGPTWVVALTRFFEWFHGQEEAAHGAAQEA